jgi:hypothetical protein
MKVELEPEEVRELLTLIVESVGREAKLSAKDAAAVKRWRSEAMKAGSEGMRELTAKVNADMERALRTKAKSAVQKPDWK